MDLKDLVKKFAEELKQKYGKILTEVEYLDSDLEKDIEDLIVTQYFSLEPEELYNPIEQDILNKIKEKNPDIEIKENNISELNNSEILKEEEEKEEKEEKEVEELKEEKEEEEKAENIKNEEEGEEEEEEKEKADRYENIEESETLKKTRLRNYTKDDITFLEDFLNTLDKCLPKSDENVLSFANDDPGYTNTISTNPYKVIPAKFPVEKLAIEVEEERERNLAIKENAQIARAKKAKKDNKDKGNVNPYEAVMDEFPDEEKHNMKYIGKPRIETLTHRLIKHTFKEILPNSNVYPSLIKEVLMIPQIFNPQVMEIAIKSLQYSVNGNYEKAISYMDKAQEIFNAFNPQPDYQSMLYFSLSLGALYENLDYDLMALKYYSDAKTASEKLLIVDPDTALVFCFLGEIFVKMQEYEWALRSYMMAKKIREETIGGDTPDTAAIYNNLGVVSFLMQSYLPANGYFKLAYEIYKGIMGLTHPRTMLIKGNLTKMNQLSFNKVVEFKTLSMYPTPVQLVQNSRKKKK